MKIVRFYECGEPNVLRLEETAIPHPKAGQVLLQVEASGVNYTDVDHRRSSSASREPLTFPSTPGVEVVGVIVEAGEGATALPMGTRVIGLLPRGGYAEYVVVPTASIIPVPPDLDAAQAVALPLQGLTAYHILATFGHIQPGERILIQAAAGGVGTLAVQLARLLEAGQIIATASTPAKLDLALSLGADVGINYTQPDWTTQVLQATDGKGVDLMLDMIGGVQFSENFACLAPLGRIVTFGKASGQRAVIDSEKLTARCSSVTGFYSGYVGTRPDLVVPALKKLFQYVLAGQLQVQVHHRFPLEEAAAAHRLMETRQSTGKIVLLPGWHKN
jgi:NADPH2:quinone reductase